MKQETIEIFIEQNERLVFRQTSAREVEAACAGCGGGKLSIFIAPERAALIFGSTTRQIYRRIESGEIHFLETESGAALVCLQSFIDQRSGSGILFTREEH